MDVNKESHFYETASIFEENWVERTSVNALRNCATGAGMGVLIQMDERIITFRPKTANCTEYTEDNKSATLTLGYHYGDGGDAALIIEKNNGHHNVICIQGGGATSINSQGSGVTDDGVSYTVNTVDVHGVCYGISKSKYKDEGCVNQACNEGGMDMVHPNKTGCLCANSHPGSYTGQDAFNDMLPVIKKGRKYVVRRLTPLECSRLQGFPDWWTDGAGGSDSAIYKMWGNGISLPTAADLIGRLAKELEKC